MKLKNSASFLKNLAITALALVGALSTTTAQDDNTLLYKISGNDIQPSYIYGTIHVLPQKDFNLKDKVKMAFDESEIIVLELDMDDPSMMVEMMQNAMMEGDHSLDKLMDAEHYAQLDSMLTNTLGVGVAAFNKMKPFMVSSQLMMNYVGDQPASFEGTFVKMAMEGQKEILGLESVKEQLDIFDKIPYQEQADDIVEMLDNPDEMADMFTKMVETYKAEDIAKMYKMMDEYFNGDEMSIDLMLHTRNRNWIPKIKEYTTLRSAFIGVGAGHLGGDKGVVALLKEAGYTVEPILD